MGQKVVLFIRELPKINDFYKNSKGFSNFHWENFSPFKEICTEKNTYIYRGVIRIST